MNNQRRTSISSVEDSNQLMVTGTVEGSGEGEFDDKAAFRLTTSDGQMFKLIAGSDVHDMQAIRGRKVCVLSILDEAEESPTLTVLGFRVITPEVFDLDTGLLKRR